MTIRRLRRPLDDSHLPLCAFGSEESKHEKDERPPLPVRPPRPHPHPAGLTA